MAEETGATGERLRELYAERFGGDRQARAVLWRTLCEGFFDRWVDPRATVLDVAAGGCEFINAVRAGTRIAVDLNPAVRDAAAPGVRVLVSSADDLAEVADGSVDVVFASNFFEHVDRPTILAVMAEARRVLRSGGRFLVLQPNIRFCADDYWMFFDHVTPIDDRALAEAFRLSGFRVVTVIPRFLPFTTKSRMPQWSWLVRAYLAFRPAWWLLGKQSFLVAERP
ncbi:class I SAM-dependent methyltransferase [Geodermatophilus sp. SYSU D00691]